MAVRAKTPCPITYRHCKKSLDCMLKFDACRIETREEITDTGVLSRWRWNEELKAKFQKWLVLYCPNARARQHTIRVLNKEPLPVLTPWEIFEQIDRDIKAQKLATGPNAKYFNAILAGMQAKSKEDLENI